jgi:signal transduction histidine kinase
MQVPTILVVEDEDDLRVSIGAVLEDRSYTVYLAQDGQEAVQLLNTAEWRPNLIVSDIMMPIMDGYEFFEVVHERTELRGIPFMFLTAKGTESDRKFARRLGVDDYLVKPFEPEEFLIAVEKKLERASELRDHAERSLDDARRTIVQLLSHELRTPLTYITGGFELINEDIQDRTETTQMSFELIANGATRLTRLTDQVILYAQLAVGHVQVQMQSVGSPFNLRDCIQSAIAPFRAEIEAKSIQLITDAPNGQFFVFGIEDMFRAALGELIRNAVTYAPQNGAVWVNLYVNGDQAAIVIADNGSGIIPEDLANVFKVLVQSERARREQQGAGLGLPIAKRVAEAHGGTLQLDSVVGQGTTATVRLRLY